MTQRISITPDPPTAGGEMTVCYDFTGLSNTEVELRIEWDPSSNPDTTIELTATQNCKKVDVPDGADGGDIIDTPDNSDDLGFLTE